MNVKKLLSVFFIKSVQQTADFKSCVVDAVVNTDAIIGSASQTQLITQMMLLEIVSDFT